MKAKKILAVLMTAAVLSGTTAATAVSTYAEVNQENLTSTITVQGLGEGVDTELWLYQAVSIDEDRNSWVVAEWAKDYFNENFEITNAEGLTKAAEGQATTYTAKSNGQTSVNFDNMPIGVYVIRAAAENTTYNPMVANTYDNTQTYIAVKDTAVTAKSSTVDLTKKEIEGDNFVGKGETVTFAIETTFPYFDEQATEKIFKINDTPTGMEITSVKSVTIGDTSVEGKNFEENEGTYTIDLTDQIGNDNENAGKKVVVTYEAVVTSEDGYSNTANSSGSTADSTVKGYTGDIILTKYASDEDNENVDDNVKLEGAKFKVYPVIVGGDGSETIGEAPLDFVVKEEGIYTPALEDDEDKVTEIETIEGGTVTIEGLGNGKYHFAETVAPEGYTVNEEGVTVEVVKDEKNTVAYGQIFDTKLSSLPSTGGIGTTIFTIGGCVIMVAAAGLYFSTRKKEEN
ncbi:SpaA isopeptide-forming pilin-related protein [Blautia sp.]|uniref:SpaA isopeptide-forming pilin-related protein n=1 Tax=Blautia sp. TaxID=1955243 RepID=UPI003AB170C5